MDSARQDDASSTRYRSHSKSSRNPSMDGADTATTNFSNPSVGQAPKYHRYPSRNPLIDHCTNEWQNNSRWKIQRDNIPFDEVEGSLSRFIKRCLAMLRAPRVRRHLLFYTVILIISTWLWSWAIWPAWAEHRLLTHSLSAQHRTKGGGLFGVNLRPTFANMIQIKDLNPQFVPKAVASQGSDVEHVSRLLFVGDVHGCLDELKALLEKAQFDAKKDHLVTTGDLIAKGPDTPSTVDYVRKLGASCVRGTHEDRALLTAQSLNDALIHTESPSTNGAKNDDKQSPSSSNPSDYAVASSLSAQQLAYLETCPVILRVGFMEHLAGDLVVAHAGLVPGVSLDQQDPSAVMSMRSINLDTHIPSKDPQPPGNLPWIKLWNKYQQSLSTRWSRLATGRGAENNRQHTTVIYGHDARSGLQLKQYSKGIDTGCVRGGKLTALILSDRSGMETVQVNCKDHRQRRPLKMEVEDVLRDGRVGQNQEEAD